MHIEWRDVYENRNRYKINEYNARIREAVDIVFYLEVLKMSKSICY